MKSVLITGASSGIGKALAELLSQTHQVYACGRNAERLAALEHCGDNIKGLSFDVTNPSQVDQVLSNIDALDIIVLNAGDCRYIDDAKHFDAQLFAEIVNVNLVAIGYQLQAMLPKLKKGGQLVLVGSSVTILPLPRAEAYGASKAGLAYLAKTLALDLKPHDIAVSLVSPGFVATPLTDKNDFAMPFLMTSEQAAVRIKKGIDKRQPHIRFPRRLLGLMQILSWLPQRWWINLAQHLVRENKS